MNPKTKLALTDPKHGVKIEDLDPTLLKEVDVFEIKSKDDLTPDLLHKIFGTHVAVIRDA